MPLTGLPSGDNKFYAGEIDSSQKTFGYGEYVLDTITPPNAVPADVTMGSLFTWSNVGSGRPTNPNKEMDAAEMSSWNNTQSLIIQHVIQDFAITGNRHQFTAPIRN